MLVLSRKANESVLIDDRITVTVVDIRPEKVRLGIDCPRDVAVHRSEIAEAIHRVKRPSSDDELSAIQPREKATINLDVHHTELLDRLVTQCTASHRLFPPQRPDVIETLIDAFVALDLDLSNVHNLDELKNAIVDQASQ